ncbi:MAG: TlyA family RNA methyltransferase [Candidatus Pacebacteria bacterium]|nr:TlyA family RNA methyltransferase [Candidatus Paceibacterota bacterium]
MRLDQALVQRKICESRTEAQELIAKGLVFVDSVSTQKQTKNVDDSMVVHVEGRREFVSRGGNKLKGVLIHLFGTDTAVRQFCSNKRVLDVGSSTGGFTDCLLSYGVLSSDAVDVGTGQLHKKIKEDTRVKSYENTDIRNFKTKESYDIVVADLSFIPLKQVFDTIISFGRKETLFLLLIKPQFEVGKGNTKKGIVKNNELVKQTLEEYEFLAKEKRVSSVKITPSSIEGGDGNKEYFLSFTL